MATGRESFLRKEYSHLSTFGVMAMNEHSSNNRYNGMCVKNDKAYKSIFKVRFRYRLSAQCTLT